MLRTVIVAALAVVLMLLAGTLVAVFDYDTWSVPSGSVLALRVVASVLGVWFLYVAVRAFRSDSETGR